MLMTLLMASAVTTTVLALIGLVRILGFGHPARDMHGWFFTTIGFSLIIVALMFVYQLIKH